MGATASTFYACVCGLGHVGGLGFSLFVFVSVFVH